MFRFEEIEQELGVPLVYIRSLPGGSINDVRLFQAGGDRVVIKYNASAPANFFTAEADGLKALKDALTIGRVPQVISNGRHWIALEYIEPNVDDSNWELLAEALKELHSVEAASFGWHQDNYMGSLPQQNGSADSFADYFMHERIVPMLRKCDRLLEKEDIDALLRLHETIEELWNDSKPVLVHGDLWSGNVFFTSGGSPILIDPAVSNSIAEVDMGMTMLFGGFDPSFYDTYYKNGVGEIEQMKCDLCNLYPLLVHIYLFGLSYRHELRSTLRRYGLMM